MHQSLTLAKKDSNKYDLIVAPWFLLANHKQGAIDKSCLLHSSLVGTQLCSTFYKPQHRGWTRVLHDELDIIGEKYIVIVDYVFCSCDVLNSWLFLVNVRICGVHFVTKWPNILSLFFLGINKYSTLKF